MVQYIAPPKVIVVPKEGAIEIKLDITINVVGQVAGAVPQKVEEEQDLKIIPDFSSHGSLSFGKED